MSKLPDLEVSLHTGAAMLKLAGLYPTLQEVLDEQVQNALDANAKRIDVELDLHTAKAFAVYDNGDGVSIDTFQGAMCTVSRGIKDDTKIGRFGIGLISPLGKCVEFRFTSCAAPEHTNYIERVFSTDNVLSYGQVVKVPQTRLEYVHESYPGKIRGSDKEKVWWRTRVTATGIIDDRGVIRSGTRPLNATDLCDSIQTKYSERIKKLRTVITITVIDENGDTTSRTVTARQFRGKKLESYEVTDKDAGKIVIQMHLTRSVDQKGKVGIYFKELNNDYQFGFAEFARSAAGRFLNETSPETMEALQSRVFEGTIAAEKVQINPTRACFERNEASLSLVVAIADWYTEHGKQYVDKKKKERDDVHYQKLASASLSRLKGLFTNSFGEIIRSFAEGTIGSGHTNKPTTGTTVPSLALDGRHDGKGSQKSPSNGKPAAPQKEHPQHMPLVVEGCGGKTRRVVSSNSTGIRIAYGELDDEDMDKLWIFDRKTGTFTFNITNNLWVECDQKSDSTVILLQDLAIILELGTLAMPQDHLKPLLDAFSHSAMGYLAQYIINSGIRFTVAKQ